MLEIDRRPLLTTIRCQDCQAQAQIFTDDRRTVDRGIKRFQADHRCRVPAPPAALATHKEQ